MAPLGAVFSLHRTESKPRDQDLRQHPDVIWGFLAPNAYRYTTKHRKLIQPFYTTVLILLSTPLFSHLAQCLPTNARCHGAQGQYVHPLAPPSPFSVQSINTPACTHIFSVALHTCFLMFLSSLDYPGPGIIHGANDSSKSPPFPSALRQG